MSALARNLLLVGVLLGFIGAAAYIDDTWIHGDGGIVAPRGPAGTCLVLGLILVGVALHRRVRRR
jgi:hypothetical protein